MLFQLFYSKLHQTRSLCYRGEEEGVRYSRLASNCIFLTTGSTMKTDIKWRVSVPSSTWNWWLAIENTSRIFGFISPTSFLRPRSRGLLSWRQIAFRFVHYTSVRMLGKRVSDDDRGPLISSHLLLSFARWVAARGIRNLRIALRELFHRCDIGDRFLVSFYGSIT